ncbi:hypothetical protein [Staphylococcus xylosus]|uniref:hypothetical protein n=1 Tax=Staphylococcus xylosus TaxID=1288 RepID=UPI001CDC63D8|nr:hypothetical protein [Staphylococcus xylosus]MCQ3816687.1 hypothetical protein [Staphylococcus xylosus]MCQ3819260.1 hypothetical protein [Staphylococcus xylosus]UBV36687.1 hypothetical protein JGY88_09495 [Staphylococcus xylosus]
MALKRVKDKYGEVCFVLDIGNKQHLIPVEDYQLAKDLGMAHTTIRKHIKQGTTNFKKYIEKYDRAKGLQRLAVKDREREERRLARIEAKQRKEQERLQMVENAKCRSKWFEHLDSNNKLAKVKIDIYGNEQLV